MELYPPQKLIRWHIIERHSMNGHFSARGIAPSWIAKSAFDVPVNIENSSVITRSEK